MNLPEFSIIIPGYNRPEPLKYTLRAAATAISRLDAPAEIILVDDGSEPPLDTQLQDFTLPENLRIVRQPNQGSIVARQTGLQLARGDYVLFLDSDDLIHPDKLRAHQHAFAETGADIVYDDMAMATLGENFSASFAPATRLESTVDSAQLLLTVQPAPHNPTYRKRYLASALTTPLIPQDRRMDPAGDVWLYYNLLLHTAKVHKIDGAFTAPGPHQDARYSQHWEKLGAAALLIAEQFVARCPSEPATAAIRAHVGARAFRSWLALPRDYDARYSDRLLAVWRSLPRAAHEALGGWRFRVLAGLLGAELAGSWVRRRNHTYASCRTLNDAELNRLLASS